MRNIFFFIMLWSVSFFGQNEKKIKVNLKVVIENSNSDTLSVFDVKDNLVAKIVSKNGRFQHTLQTVETMHSFSDGVEWIYFFLKDSGDVEFKADAKRMYETLVF